MLIVSDLLEATGGRTAFEGITGLSGSFSGVSIDSRNIKSSEIFVPLKGDRFDGHDFVADALKTCAGAIVNSQFPIADLRAGDKTIIIVEDTLTALQDLARYLRSKFSGHVLGIVGSNGKTTTKELIASILGQKIKVLKTEGNLNNHIGMPLSITRVQADTGVMALEMGTNRPGDVDELCKIAMPDTGVVTNIGYEHLEGFGSLEKVRESELEIVKYVKKLVLNADDMFLLGGVSTAFTGEMITFGVETERADITARDIVFFDDVTSFTLCVPEACINIDSRLPGLFNVYNSLAAASVAHALGSSMSEIKKGLESFRGVKMRFEIEDFNGSTFLNDIYNANPSSMEASIKEMVRRFKAESGRYKRAVVVLGDMLELGAYAVQAHKDLGTLLSGLPVDVFLGAGPLMALAVAGFRGKGTSTASSGEAGSELLKVIGDSDLVLIKGSRGMKMEEVLKTVKRGLADAV